MGNILANISSSVLYTYGMIAWALLWIMPTGVVHIFAILLWELPYILGGINSETLFNISLIIKIAILAYPITTLSPWSMLKTTFGGLILFIGMIISLSFIPPDIALKNILMDVGLTSKAYTVLIYLLFSNLLIPVVARDDLEAYHFLYMALGIDEVLTVLSRGYIHFSIPAIVSMFIGIYSIIKKHSALRGAHQ